MNEINFSDQLINELESNNYFGTDAADTASIRARWISEMGQGGFEIGGTYDEDEFDRAAQNAIGYAVGFEEHTNY